MDYYKYICPRAKELDYKVYWDTKELDWVVEHMLSAINNGQHLRDILKTHEHPHTMIMAAVKTYLYFLDNPQYFDNNADYVVAWCYQSIKRATKGISNAIDLYKIEYNPIPNAYINKNKDLFLALLHKHCTSKHYPNHFYQPSEDEMIQAYLTKNKPTKCPITEGDDGKYDYIPVNGFNDYQEKELCNNEYTNKD